MAEEAVTLPPLLWWLQDAPLFIDQDQVGRFYDAIVQPVAEEGETSVAMTKEMTAEVAAALEVSGEITPHKLLELLAPVFGRVEAKAEVSGKGEGKVGSERTQTFIPIKTAQRQLILLTRHYILKHPSRLSLVSSPAEPKWREPGRIRNVPRSLVFLDLPGVAEAKVKGSQETKLVPMAAEFADGSVKLLFPELRSKDGRTSPPKYPQEEKEHSPAELSKKRAEYWQWFNENFDSSQAMLIIENSARAAGRIRWIDYRVPLTDGGESLHLHVSPRGEYDAGVFAYNFVKRGFKHGVRIVGTLKSEPDLNVLAIYDK